MLVTVRLLLTAKLFGKIFHRYSVDQLKEDVTALEDKVTQITSAAEKVESDFKTEIDEIKKVSIY